MISLLSQRLMTDTWNFIQLFFVGLHRGFQTISTQDQMKGGKNRSGGGGGTRGYRAPSQDSDPTRARMGQEFSSFRYLF